jgi:hypothetical protein
MPISVPFVRAVVRTKAVARGKFTPFAALLAAVIAVVLLAAAPARAQLQPTGTSTSHSPASAPAHSSAPAGGRGTRVFMSDSRSWKEIGGWGLAGQSKPGRGAPADADGVRAFEKHCSQYPLTNDRDAATYVILLDQINEKAPRKGRDRITVYNRAGIAVYSNSTRLLDDSIRDACHAMEGKK